MIGRLIRDRKGTAATEFALALPMMFALLFVGLEAGHYFWTEHKLVKAVRDGARFASRAQIEDMCAINPDTGALSNNIDAGLLADIRAVTVTGHIPTGDQDVTDLPVAKVPGWTVDQVVVTPGCGDFVSTGIYDDLGANGALVTVSSGPVSYPSILNGLGVLDDTFTISAEASAAVTGI